MAAKMIAKFPGCYMSNIIKRKSNCLVYSFPIDALLKKNITCLSYISSRYWIYSYFFITFNCIKYFIFMYFYKQSFVIENNFPSFEVYFLSIHPIFWGSYPYILPDWYVPVCFSLLKEKPQSNIYWRYIRVKLYKVWPFHQVVCS